MHKLKVNYRDERGKPNRTYTTWDAMKKRCRQEGRGNYLKKGIKVCDRWLESFENFLSDMGERPEGKTLDRVDTNGNYEPENCRWATPKEQARNRIGNKIVNYKGKNQSLSEVVEALGLNYRLVIQRLDDGWSLEKSINAPIVVGKKTHCKIGHELTDENVVPNSKRRCKTCRTEYMKQRYLISKALADSSQGSGDK